MSTPKLNTAEDVVSVMQRAGKLAVDEINKWLSEKLAVCPNDKEMQRMFRRDAIDYEEIADTTWITYGVDLYWKMDTASRDSFDEIAERVADLYKPRSQVYDALANILEFMSPPDDAEPDEFDNWSNGKLHIYFEFDDGKRSAEAAIFPDPTVFGPIEGGIVDAMDAFREEFDGEYDFTFTGHQGAK